MAWNLNVSSTNETTEASSHVMNTIRGREESRSDRQTNKIDRNGYDVVGINAAQVEDMRTAINTYVEKIYKKIEEIDAEAETTKAFRGDDVAGAVKTYINTVKEYCINLTSQLLAFSDKLAEVQEAWQKSVKDMAEQISASSGDTAFNKGTMYTEQKTTEKPLNADLFKELHPGMSIPPRGTLL